MICSNFDPLVRRQTFNTDNLYLLEQVTDHFLFDDPLIDLCLEVEFRGGRRLGLLSLDANPYLEYDSHYAHTPELGFAATERLLTKSMVVSASGEVRVCSKSNYP
jgi:hypothetical protein